MIKKRKIFFIFSGILLLISVVSLSFWGLNFGIDFTGGSLLEIKFSQERPAITKIKEALKEERLNSLIVQPSGEDSYILRFQEIEETVHNQVIAKLYTLDKNLEEKRFDAVGPVIGEELKRRTFWAIILSLLAIISYIGWAFRKVSWPIASWKYGLIAVIALFHDIIIVLGLFSILGHFAHIEVGVPFVAALMTILGYSVNDTIVIFDRIRENLIKAHKEHFEDIIQHSVKQSYVRSINTSLTTLAVLISIFFFGGETIRDFIMALIAGIFFGTYSSLFIASPLLVVWENWKHRK
ncbi:protein translocase subunit SecF [bacterium]|nr:MAG: protein translocase subunit SecF [bacterium]